MDDRDGDGFPDGPGHARADARAGADPPVEVPPRSDASGRRRRPPDGRHRRPTRSEPAPPVRTPADVGPGSLAAAGPERPLRPRSRRAPAAAEETPAPEDRPPGRRPRHPRRLRQPRRLPARRGSRSGAEAPAPTPRLRPPRPPRLPPLRRRAEAPAPAARPAAPAPAAARPGGRGAGRPGRDSRFLKGGTSSPLHPDRLPTFRAPPRAPSFMVRGARRSRRAGGAATRRSPPGPCASSVAGRALRALVVAPPARGRLPAACPRPRRRAARPALRAASGVVLGARVPSANVAQSRTSVLVVARERDQRVQRLLPLAPAQRERHRLADQRVRSSARREQPVVAAPAEMAERAGDRGQRRWVLLARGEGAQGGSCSAGRAGVLSELAEDVGGELAPPARGSAPSSTIASRTSRCRGRPARRRAAAIRRGSRHSACGALERSRGARDRAARGRSGS